jgi:integrase
VTTEQWMPGVHARSAACDADPLPWRATTILEEMPERYAEKETCRCRTNGRQNTVRALLGTAWRDSDVVFTVGDGGPLVPRTFIRRYQALVKTAGAPALPFHSIRHAHATPLVRQGVHLKVVSERLGHSGIQITADTYAHVTPDMQRASISGVDTALFG